MIVTTIEYDKTLYHNERGQSAYIFGIKNTHCKNPSTHDTITYGHTISNDLFVKF